MVEIVETLDTIVRLQSEVIDELFRLLSQHITVDEAGKLDVVDKINQAVTLKADAQRWRL